MGASGTTPTRGRGRILAARTFFALLVAWGAILEMTRPSTFTTHMPVTPGTASAVSPGVTYTSALVKTTVRGWPVEFYLKTNLAGGLSPFNGGIRLEALLCDFIVLGVLVVAAWNLPGTCHLRFDLADMFTVTAAIALMLSFHIVAWNRHLELSQLAIDIGIFSAVIAIVRGVRGLAAGLSWSRARQAGGR